MNLESLIVFVVVLGVLVFFHELGHFIAAKLSGMRVEEFAFGFGPRLVTLFKRNQTEYTIHAFPLGGFVKITGMEPGEEDIADGFQAQALWKRAIVIFAGPLFSFILAVIVFQFVGLYWGFQDESKTLNKVLMVNPQTVASRIGLRAGDQILEIDGAKITNGTEMVEKIHRSPGKAVTLLVKHDGHISTRTAIPSWSISYLGAGWSFMNDNQAVVEGLDEDSQAKKAGIETGDKLVSINGHKIVGGAEMDAAIRTSDSHAVDLELLRNDQVVKISVTPRVQSVDFAGARWYFPGAIAYKIDAKNPQSHNIRIGDRLLSIGGAKIKTGEQMITAANGGSELKIEIKRDREPKPVRLTVKPGKVESTVYEAIGLLGFTPQFAFVKKGPTESIMTGWERTIGLVQMIFSSLAPSRIGKNVGGPLLIAKQTSMTVSLGPYYVVQMGGMLSMSLAVINLFPIPLFDGGHLALLAVEAVRKRRLTQNQMQRVQMIGLVIIGLLIVTIFFSDIHKILGGQVPQ